MEPRCYFRKILSTKRNSGRTSRKFKKIINLEMYMLKVEIQEVYNFELGGLYFYIYI